MTKEIKIKKLALIAALAMAAVFTACGDDDSVSASTKTECKVTSTDNSATATTSVAGVTTTSTYTLTENGYKITYGSEGMPETEVPNEDITKEDLVDMANQVCELLRD